MNTKRGERLKGVDGSQAEGVVVVSVWLEGAPGGFLGRLTKTGPNGESTVETVTNPQAVLDSVEAWLNSLEVGASS
jgi:hypothetical protein